MPSIHQPVPCPSINPRKTNDLCVCVFEGVITVKISSTELRERRQSSSAFKIRLQTFLQIFLSDADQLEMDQVNLNHLLVTLL